MNPEYLKRMGADELDAYAEALGFSARAAKTADAKRALIERRRERGVDVTALGVELHIPMKAAHDLRVTRLIESPTRTDADVEEAFRILLGSEQMDELAAAATDEDGTIDAVALAMAYNSVLTSEELKNS